MMDMDTVQADRLHLSTFAYCSFASDVLKTLPQEVSPEDRQLFAESLEEEPIRAAKIWEEQLLVKYPLPFFQVRVGDVRATLRSPATAYRLYRKAQAGLGVGIDPVFDAFVEQFVDAIVTDEAEQIAKNARLPSEQQAALADAAIAREKEENTKVKVVQLYKPTRRHPRPATVPMIPLRNIKDSVKSAWNRTGKNPDMVWDRYLTAFFIEINIQDDSFQISPHSARKLSKEGLVESAVEVLPQSRMKDPAQIIAAIQDTRKAYGFAGEISARSHTFCPDDIRTLHGIIMRSSRFYPNLKDGQQAQQPSEYKYVNVGVTRTISRKNVIAKRDMHTMGACPFQDVDSELEYLCSQAVQWLRTYAHQHPVSIAAWLQLLVSRMSPFEEGNQRLASLIASIPLFLQGLPPVIVPRTLRKEYADSLYKAYDGNLTPLAECMCKSMYMSVEEVGNM